MRKPARSKGAFDRRLCALTSCGLPQDSKSYGNESSRSAQDSYNGANEDRYAQHFQRLSKGNRQKYLDGQRRLSQVARDAAAFDDCNFREARPSSTIIVILR